MQVHALWKHTLMVFDSLQLLEQRPEEQGTKALLK